eukprot:SAG31_NODE_13893_length_839_cov_1.045946_1_plen_98_part_10
MQQAGKCWFVGADGTEREWEMVRRVPVLPAGPSTGQSEQAAAVDIIALIRDARRPISVPRLALVFVYRPPVDSWVLEFPAGMVDQGETIEAAAVRELQ